MTAANTLLAMVEQNFVTRRENGPAAVPGPAFRPAWNASPTQPREALLAHPPSPELPSLGPLPQKVAGVVLAFAQDPVTFGRLAQVNRRLRDFFANRGGNDGICQRSWEAFVEHERARTGRSMPPSARAPAVRRYPSFPPGMCQTAAFQDSLRRLLAKAPRMTAGTPTRAGPRLRLPPQSVPGCALSARHLPKLNSSASEVKPARPHCGPEALLIGAGRGLPSLDYREAGVGRSPTASVEPCLRDILIDCVSLTSLILSGLPGPESLDFLPAQRRLRSLRIVEEPPQGPRGVRPPRRSVWLHGECFPLLRDVVFIDAAATTRLQYLPHLESLAAISDPPDEDPDTQRPAPCLDLEGTRRLRRLNLASSSAPWVLRHADLSGLEALSYRYLSAEQAGKLPAALAPTYLPRLKRIHLEHCWGLDDSAAGLQHLDFSGCPDLEEVVLVDVRLGRLTFGHHPNLKLSITGGRINQIDSRCLGGALPRTSALPPAETAIYHVDAGVLASGDPRCDWRQLMAFLSENRTHRATHRPPALGQGGTAGWLPVPTGLPR